MFERAHARRSRSDRAAACLLVCAALTLSTGCAASLRRRAAPGTFVTTPTRGSTVTLDFAATSPDRRCDPTIRECGDALAFDVHESLSVMLAFYFCHVPGPRAYASRLRFDDASVTRDGLPRVHVRWRFDLRDERGSVLVDVSGRGDTALDPASEQLDAATRQRLKDEVLERIRIALRNADLT